MMKHLKTTFFLREKRKNKKGETPIYVRLSWNGQTKRFASGIYVCAKMWDSVRCEVSERHQSSDELNMSLEVIRNQISQRYFKLMYQADLTLEDILDDYKGKPKVKYTLNKLVKKHNQDFLKRVGVDRSIATYKKYQVSEKRIHSYLKSIKQRDISLSKLNFAFIKEFSMYLKTNYNYNHNSVAKHVKNLKSIISYGIELGVLDKNPFQGYQFGYKETPQVILTTEELFKIESISFDIPRLELVRNLFLFQCYTGLSYIDMARLTHQNIVKGNDNNDWLVLNRTKSNIPVRIPLLLKAKEIIFLYNEVILSTLKPLLPMYPNQKMNSYLKEIADLCRINKNLTSHVGRRTFATTVLLSNGIPIESVSRLLGHTNLRTTQVYAKVVDNKISKEMKQLENVLRKKA